jgi:hypothetical protein
MNMHKMKVIMYHRERYAGLLKSFINQRANKNPESVCCINLGTMIVRADTIAELHVTINDDQDIRPDV